MWFPPTCFRTQSHQLNSLLISNLLSPLPWRFLLDSIPRSPIWEKFLSVPAPSRHNSPLGETTILPGRVVWTSCFQLLTTDSSLCSPHLVSLITHLWGQNSMAISQFLCSLMLLQNLMLGSLHSWPGLLPSPEPSFSFPTSSPQLPFFSALTGTAPVVHQLCPLLSTHDLTTACIPTLNEHFGEDAHFLLGSLSMTSEPHFQLSGRHALLTVLQTKQTQPAKFKVLTLQEFCISARLVLLKFNMHTSQLGHHLTVQILVL